MTTGKAVDPREVFPGFYSPSASERNDVWRNGLVVVDASALLSLYRLSVASRDALLDILQTVSERLWITHRALGEFEANRLTVIEQQRSQYAQLRKELEDSRRRIAGNIGHHPLIDRSEFENRVETGLKEVVKFLDELEAAHPNPLQDTNPLGNDVVRDALGKLLAGRIGPPRDVASVAKDAARRYEAKVPPGYEDAKKPESKRYGDLIIWYDMLDLAEQQSKPILFVTEDSKEDWWWFEKGERIGPRHELVQEMWSRCRQRFHLTRLEPFMRSAESELQHEVGEEAIEEVATLEKYWPSLNTVNANEPFTTTIDFSAVSAGSLDQRFFDRQGIVFTDGAFVGFVQGDDALIGPVAGAVRGGFTSLSAQVAPGAQGTATYTLAAYERGNQIARTSMTVTQDDDAPKTDPFGYFTISIGPLPTNADSFSLSNMFASSSSPDRNVIEFGVASITFSR